MATREQIRIELEQSNPSTEIGGVRYYPGDTQYESIMEQWIDSRIDQPEIIPSPVEMWQVKVWLARKNISLSTVSEILSTKIPEGPEREEALIRWEYVTVVPYDNILVGLIASELNLDKETAWREISSI